MLLTRLGPDVDYWCAGVIAIESIRIGVIKVNDLLPVSV